MCCIFQNRTPWEICNFWVIITVKIHIKMIFWVVQIFNTFENYDTFFVVFFCCFFFHVSCQRAELDSLMLKSAKREVESSCCEEMSNFWSVTSHMTFMFSTYCIFIVFINELSNWCTFLIYDIYRRMHILCNNRKKLLQEVFFYVYFFFFHYDCIHYFSKNCGNSSICICVSYICVS